MNNYDIIIVGSGYAGSIIARELAEKNKKILILEKRSHIAGNMYDYFDKNTNILVHKYGPHIGHYPDRETFEYLKKYSDFVPYKHKVLVKTKNKNFFFIPFNLNGIDKIFSKKEATATKRYLSQNFEKKVTLMEIKKHLELKKLYSFLYRNVFRDYTIKMWGLSPEQLDPLVTSRIPIRLDYNDNHFLDEFQYQPKKGYTNLFCNLLDHKNIDVRLNQNAKDLIEIKENKIFYQKKLLQKPLVWTGPIDELFDFKYGELPYRSLHFKISKYNVDSFQEIPTINYPTKVKKTRTTEMKKINCQKNIKGATITLTEYPGKFKKQDSKFGERFYPIITDSNKEKYNKYYSDSKRINNLFLCGRLADYKYYDMEKIIKVALEESKKINKFFN